MVDANTFDLKPNFPIASVAQLYADRPTKEAAMRAQQQQQLLQGIEMFGKGVDSLVQRRMAMAQALTQADVLLKNTEIAKQAGIENPATQPVVNTLQTAASPSPVTIGQTAQGTDAQGNMLESPVPNMPSIPRNMELIRQKLATAIQGTKGDDFLKFIKPDTVQETVYQKDAKGNIIGSQTRTVPKGSKSTVIGPQVPPRPTGPGMSEDRATLKYIEDFDKDSGVIRAKQALDGAENVRNLATSGNPIAAAAIPTFMARASGEVGNLSEADKAPFGGSREILTKFEASLKQLSTGQLTEDNKNFLIDISNVMQSSAEKNLDRRGRDMAKQFSHVKGEKPENIFSALRPSRQYIQEPDKPKSDNVLSVGGMFHGQKIVGVKLKKS